MVSPDALAWEPQPQFTQRKEHHMLSKFSKVGITSDVCYAAGFASIALSFASHFISR